MKKISFILFLAVFYFTPLLAAAPHALEDEAKQNKPYAIDILAKKQPLKFFYKDCSRPYAKEIVKAYQSWFENAKREIKSSKHTENFKDYTDIIDFAANEEGYICTQEQSEAHIAFFIEGENYLAHGPRGSQGVFYHNGSQMKIAIQEGTMRDEEPSPYKFYEYSTLKHEIGHSLRMQDLYRKQFYDTAGKYGSGIRDSLMNEEKSVTCDDADAIINALYLVKKINGENPADLEFESFCTSYAGAKTHIHYKNARMTNREPVIIDYQGSRTIYTYCKDGRPRSITKISPHNYEKLYQTLQEPIDCEFTPLEEKEFSAEGIENAVIVDYESGKTIKKIFA